MNCASGINDRLGLTAISAIHSAKSRIRDAASWPAFLESRRGSHPGGGFLLQARRGPRTSRHARRRSAVVENVLIVSLADSGETLRDGFAKLGIGHEQAARRLAPTS